MIVEIYFYFSILDSFHNIKYFSDKYMSKIKYLMFNFNKF